MLVVDSGGIGGQARSSSLIRNYLGFGKGISGARLAEEAYEQAWAFGATFLFMHRVTTLRRSGDWFVLSLADGRLVSARAVDPRDRGELPAAGDRVARGADRRGVFYGGPASEASAMAGKDVYVVGGGTQPGRPRSTSRATPGRSRARPRPLARSRHVALPRPGDRGRAEGRGAHRHDGRRRRRRRRASSSSCSATRRRRGETVPADALFVLIGARPQTDWLPAEIARDPYGFVLTGRRRRGTAGRWGDGRSRSRRACRACSQWATCGTARSSALQPRSERARSPCSSSTGCSTRLRSRPLLRLIQPDARRGVGRLIPPASLSS